ncbi:DMT family transporter [Rhodobacter sp. Har01]|uniref:DMT family transporter n=1 Tax=Rhodobacter sp. Har01 TaxID=2883999 RepID=UPI001D07DDA0|nr:DMT family transporter [Rhodobacter sp. Har01]MCB6177710.1 DMT family transporter [Rhodobacter sp. Har01]
MTTNRVTLIASSIVLWTGIFWGVYWLPVRALAERGLPGAWGTAAITLGAVGLLLPVAWTNRRQIATANRIALASIALGGAAFALYSIGFTSGRVAIIILLWFLSPVWATLIGRFLMGWPIPRLRLLAIAVGLSGLVLMLGAGGGPPFPKGIGEWMSFLGGVLWAFSTVGIRARSDIGPASAAFVFALGAAATSLLLAPLLTPLSAPSPGALIPAIALALLAGGLWWGVSMAGLMWATVRLDPARVSILLMTEVLVGAVSAAVLAGELLDPLEIAGGALVLCAGVLEVWPARRTPSRGGT